MRAWSAHSCGLFCSEIDRPPQRGRRILGPKVSIGRDNGKAAQQKSIEAPEQTKDRSDRFIYQGLRYPRRRHAVRSARIPGSPKIRSKRAHCTRQLEFMSSPAPRYASYCCDQYATNPSRPPGLGWVPWCGGPLPAGIGGRAMSSVSVLIPCYKYGHFLED